MSDPLTSKTLTQSMNEKESYSSLLLFVFRLSLCASTGWLFLGLSDISPLWVGVTVFLIIMLPVLNILSEDPSFPRIYFRERLPFKYTFWLNLSVALASLTVIRTFTIFTGVAIAGYLSIGFLLSKFYRNVSIALSLSSLPQEYDKKKKIYTDSPKYELTVIYNDHFKTPNSLTTYKTTIGKYEPRVKKFNFFKLWKDIFI